MRRQAGKGIYVNEFLAVCYPTLQAAEAGSMRLSAAVADGLISVRACAVVWVDHRSRTYVRHRPAPWHPSKRSWAAWLMLTVGALHGSPSELIEDQHGCSAPVLVDPALSAEVAGALDRAEAAVVVTLADPTPLLLVEALRASGMRLLRSSLSETDELLVSLCLA